MEKNYKIVPFDIEKAKAGAEVVTVKDNLKVEILKYDFKSDYSNKLSILAIINYNNGLQVVYTYCPNGSRFEKITHDMDLRIKKEVKYRRMTNQELSWWLRDCPEEHRELKSCLDSLMVWHDHSYSEPYANDECPKDIVIRSNGGEWKEPIVEEE